MEKGKFLPLDEVLKALAGGGILIYSLGWDKSSVSVVRYGKVIGNVRADVWDRLRYMEVGLKKFHSEAYDVINSHDYYKATKKTPADAVEYNEVVVPKINKRVGAGHVKPVKIAKVW